MAEIVNLRTARKRKERGERERLAAENRVRHGMSKAERLAAKKQAQHTTAVLDGHFRDRPGDGD